MQSHSGKFQWLCNGLFQVRWLRQNTLSATAKAAARID
jgi:hypothetical protein